jgi:hypothetical protein
MRLTLESGFRGIGAAVGLAVGAASTARAQVHHYAFFGMEREKLRTTPDFLATPRFEGAQVRYAWRQLEPGRDEYDFSLIREDLDLLTRHGKKLWIQLQDVSFSEQYILVPKYLLADSAFHGGVARQYSNPSNAGGGWVARRWDPAVQRRLDALFAALGKEFDGRIVGINLAETSIEFGKDDAHAPAGFTPSGYVTAIIDNMAALKRAFPKSIVEQYVNFMPGEWRPDVNRGYLDSVYAAARRMGVAVGGPDVLPHRPGQLGSSYPLIRASRGIVPIGMAVQDGNLAELNRVTGKRVTAEELLAFATGYLGANYMFWGIEEPYFTTEIIPLVRRTPP